MGHAHDLENPLELVRQQEGAAADRQELHVPRLGLHPVDAFLDHACNMPQHGPAARAIQVCDLGAVTDVEQARGDADVARGELAAAKGERVRGEAIADREWADRDWIERDMAASPEAE